ncbi:putative UV-damaged DNA binding protein [Trichodelitschia bisporula]|uniref:DNA damage-binding protein 1 n=1 Tax=Trichodelitschia bisporula TaxID=703511 RepID=A0A6G1HKM3_9PEZI|nr:putative UV-damaged DNA binding protein [Trichodelitschia bisporula]
MAYIAPIHRPSSVRHALKLQFLQADEDCLAVAKSNRLEFYVQTQDGLELRESISIYGRVTILNKIRPPASPTDHLFVGTDRAMYFTLFWDQATSTLRTEKEFLDLSEKSAQPSQTGDRCTIDPTGEFMILEVYEGIITTLPLTRRGKKKADVEYGIIGEPAWTRIPEFFVRSSAFLQRTPKSGEKGDRPRLALLYEDHEGTVKVRVRQLSYTAGGGGDPIAELEDIPNSPTSPLDRDCRHLIPISGPPYGMLILGETGITYFDDLTFLTHTQPLDDATIFVAWEKIDTQRYVLADEYGKLYLLMLILDAQEKLERWRIDVLGVSSRASVLVYLDQGRIFIGSHQGDSRVVQITEEAKISVLQSMPNIGPILDFTVMDMGNRSGEGQGNEYSSGQARIVTGSGAWNDGSLRSVRSGVGLEDLGFLGDIPHVVDLFSLKSDTSSQHVDTLVVSFIDETRVFAFSENGDVEELLEFKGMSFTEETLLAMNLPDGGLLQVTSSAVRLVDLDGGMVRSEWRPPQPITALAANDRHLVVSVGGDTIQVIKLTDAIIPSTQRTFPSGQQVACVTISSELSGVCAVGFWQDSLVAVLNLDTLDTLESVKVSSEEVAVPRSLLLASLFPDQPPTLFLAMADGNVVKFDIDPCTYKLSSKKSTILGTQQAVLKTLPRADGTSSVFVACENPSLIYVSEGRIIYSAVTAENTTCLCSFDSAAYPGAVAIATADGLRVSLIESERTTHIQTLALGETVRRVAYSPALKAFGLGTIERTLEYAVEKIESHFKLADEVLFQELDTWPLEQDELVESVIRAELPDGTGGLVERFVVGTSYLDDAPAENHRGRILIFEVTPTRALNLLTENQVKGMCRCLAIVEGKIVAALVKTVVIYSLTYPSPSRPTLAKCATYRTSTAPIDIAVTGNLIAVADLMKSVSVVEYHTGDPGVADSLTEVARHYQTAWGTAVANVAPDTWLESDAEGNLIQLKRDQDGPTETDRRRLQLQATICLGEMVNRIRSIDVVTQPGAAVIPKAFIATVEGSIYLFALISEAKQNALMELQTNLAERIQSPGYIRFNEYRAFRTQTRQNEEPVRFVDGELIEKFLDCSPETQEQAVIGVGMSVDEVKEMVESLRRLH